MKSAMLAVLLLGLASLAQAGVPRVIVIEEFGATWCTYCPGARCALEALQNELGYDQILHFEDHCSGTDPFTTSETTARENYYGVPGYPTVWFDGSYNFVGANDCSSMTNTYRAIIQERQSDTDGMSPVAIQSSMQVNGSTSVTMTATYKLVDPAPLNNLRATLLLYEDNVSWCCGYGGQNVWQHTTRKIYDQNITLTNVLDQVTVTTTVPIGAGWDPTQLHAVAYLQNVATKEIIQGQLVGRGTAFDYSLYFQNKVRSVPDANGTAVFQASITNVSNADETLTLAPGTPFGTWTTDFLVCGDSNPHSGPTQITLAPNDVCNFQVRVHTDAAHEIRSGTFQVTSQTTGRMQETTLRVFNGSPSIFFVDNDGGQSQQTGLVDGLNANSYLFDTWDAQASGDPAYSKMNGFDIVVWHTGGRVSANCLTSTDAANLAFFMDQGGSLFLTSNNYLNQLGGGTNPFTTDYLGVASYNLDKAYTQLNGVSGDVIGNGMSLPLHFQYPSFAKGDDAVPGATAATDFTAPDGSHAVIRNTMGDGSKSVFMAERFDAISETDPDPNNAKTLVHRVIEWLKPAGTAGTQPIDTHLVSGITTAKPNPFSQGTEISFALDSGAAGGPVRLEIFDLGGRRVSKLVDGVMTPGVHVQNWNGMNADGSRAQSGVYFARLTTREGTRSAKLLLLK